jgi:hypothetical protein
VAKICPLCKRTYPGITKVCPLNHCPNCGTTNLFFNEEKRDEHIGGALTTVVITVLLIMIFSALKMPLLTTMIILILGAITVTGILLSASPWYCRTCNATFRSPVKDVPLKEVPDESIGRKEVRGDTCPVCGAPAEPGAKYCWRCGAKLD